MNGFDIITDSSADLSAQLVDRLNVKVVPLSVLINGSEYRNYPDERELSYREFYEKAREKDVELMTGAANAAAWEDAFEDSLSDGRDVLCIAFSSGLSGTSGAAVLAAQAMAAKYPERRVAVVDSLCASLGQGLLVWLCCARRDAGDSLDAVEKYAEDTKLNVCHWFTVDDLHFLRRGGRISSAVAIVGSMLQIKPVMHMDNTGHLQPIAKVRGRRGALRGLFEKLHDTAVEPGKQTVFISHGDCAEDADYLAGLIREAGLCREVITGYVGPVIGAHSGPGTVALFFIGDHR